MNPRRRQFKPYTPKKRVKHNSPDTLSWSRLPTYLLPDVLLNETLTETLAELIYETFQENGQGPANILTYNRKGVESDNLCSWNLSTHINHLVQDILYEQKNSPLPVILVGYSSGTTLAIEIALELQKKGLQSKIITIDGPARSMLRTFASSLKGTPAYDKFKDELTALVSYAARLSGYAANKLSKQGLSTETIDALSEQQLLSALQLNPDKMDFSGLMRAGRFEIFFNDMIDQLSRIPPSDMMDKLLQDKFSVLLKIGQRTVINEISAEAKDRTKVPKIYTIFTQETANKFGAETEDEIAEFNGDWTNYANEVIALNSPKDRLGLAKHSALLNKENAKQIAELMYTTLKNDPDLTTTNLHSLQTKASFNQARNNSEVDDLTLVEADLSVMESIVGRDKLMAAVARMFKHYNPPHSSGSSNEQSSSLGTSPTSSDEETYSSVPALTTPQAVLTK